MLALHLLPSLNRYLTLDVLGQNLGPLLLALSVLTGLAEFALTAAVPWPTGLMIAALTISRCSVAAFRARQLRFLGFSLHTFINVFLLLPLKAYALCTLTNSDWLSREATNLPLEGEKQVIIANSMAGPDATTKSGPSESIHRTDPAHGSSRLVASDAVCSSE
jgi:N-acetylglucosaminyltransferase